MPIYHPDLVDPSIQARIDQDGLCGFTGNDLPPPSPSNLPSCLPALAEWGITKETMIVSEPATEEQKLLIDRAGKEVHRFIKNRWKESDWETAWFVNPPVSACFLRIVCIRLKSFLYNRDCKVSQAWLIFTSLLATNRVLWFVHSFTFSRSGIFWASRFPCYLARHCSQLHRCSYVRLCRLLFPWTDHLMASSKFLERHSCPHFRQSITNQTK